MASVVCLIVVSSCIAVSVAVPSAELTKRQQITGQITMAPELNHSLLVCNAYAYTRPLDVFSMRSNIKLNDNPIAYKSCSQLVAALEEGDKLNFKAGGLEVGTFAATGLPKQSTSLLLVPHRRDNKYMSITFESHAFSELQASQLAVIDAYKGRKEGVVTIRDEPKTNGNLREAALQEPQRTERLNYKSIVALNPGKYQVGLARPSSLSDVQYQSLDVPSVPGKYVLMRVGVDDSTKDDRSNPFPEELVLFQSAALLHHPQRAAIFAWVALLSLTTWFA